MLLPTAKTERKKDIRDFVTLIYGQPKIGKSTFCSNADGALFIATEPGLNDLEVYQVPVSSWSEFLDVCKELASGNHQFRTVVIDTIDNLYKMCVDHILKKNNLQHQSDLEYGKGYDLVNTEFQKKLTALSMLPYGLMMTSHAVEKEVKTRTGKEYKITLTLPNSARKIVLGMVDFILYAEVQEVKDENDGSIVDYTRVIHTQPTTIYEAGNRTQNPMPDTLPLDYHAFSDALKTAIANRGQQTSATTPETKPESATEVKSEAKPELQPTTLPQSAGQSKPAPRPTTTPQPMRRSTTAAARSSSTPTTGNSK